MNEPEQTDEIHWLPITEALSHALGNRPSPKQLRNWALVLSARNIPFKPVPEKKPVELYVPANHINIAAHEITLYLEENSKNEPVRNFIEPSDNVMVSVSVLLLLGIFHNLTYFQISGFGHNSIDWLQLGSANSAKILAGEWWRAITALTLHTDGQHLLGNILIGGYFVVRLCQWTGTGLGWALILSSGVMGNLLNALVQNSGHNAVGASTAIFGAIGIAGALGTTQSRKLRIRLWFLPLAAAGILLAFLGAGSGDSHTDVGAHLFGFICGVLLGIPAGVYINKKGSPGRRDNRILASTALGTILFAWTLALIR